MVTCNRSGLHAASWGVNLRTPSQPQVWGSLFYQLVKNSLVDRRDWSDKFLPLLYFSVWALYSAHSFDTDKTEIKINYLCSVRTPRPIPTTCSTYPWFHLSLSATFHNDWTPCAPNHYKSWWRKFSNSERIHVRFAPEQYVVWKYKYLEGW